MLYYILLCTINREKMKQQLPPKCYRYPFGLFIFLYVNYCLINEIKTWDSGDLEDRSHHTNFNDDAEILDFSDSNFKLPDKAYYPKIKSVSIKSRIRFRYARTRIISTIVNPDPSKSHEVNFKLRIPKEAFITKFEMRVDGGPQTYKANVTSSNEAKKIFQFAKLNGRSVTLGLIEQSSVNFDEVSIKFIIGAKKDVLFLLVYEERVSRTQGKYESIYHLIPELLSNKTVYRIEVTIEETEKVIIHVPTPNESNSCEFYYSNATIIENRSNKQAKITWSNQLENSDSFCDFPKKEFAVSYSMEDEASSGHVLIRNGYFVHFFSPNNTQPIKKHVVFVLDISDSMVGTKLKQLQSAMNEILDELKMEDYFNIITFSNEIKVWSFYKGDRSQFLFPFPANEDHKDSARYFVRNLTPHGSTNIHSALTYALQMCKNVSSSVKSPKRFISRSRYQEVLPETLPPDVQSIILFFTDGEATSGIVNKPYILTSIKILNYESKIPIFSLAFGGSADFEFLTKVSLRNRAFARKVYEHADASLQVADFYREISSPILANLSFKYTPSATSGFDIVNVTNLSYPMIFKGTETLVVGKLQRKNHIPIYDVASLDAKISGTDRSGIISYNSEIRDCTVLGTCNDESDSDDQCIEKLFVYLTIKRLLKEEASYTSGSSTCWSKRGNYNNWYEIDNSTENCYSGLREQIVELAMQYGFVTPYTSLVMRTKSIFEEEIDVLIDPEEENADWELFLGNMNPLPKTSKLTAIGIPEIDRDPYTHQELPEALALTEAIDNKIDHHEIYKNVNVDAESKSESILLPSSHEFSRNISETSLTLNDITWIPLGATLASQSIFVRVPITGQEIFVLDRRQISMSQTYPNENTSSEFLRSCNSSRVENGTCNHLSTCVQADFVDDFQLYLQYYWCPLRHGQQIYLGVCCRNPHINKTEDVVL